MTRVGAITASLYIPSGYVLADGSTKNRADYPRLVNLINKYNLWTDDTVTALGKYGKGDNSTTFVLPNLIDRHIKYTNSAGIKLEAGLPDITGELGLWYWHVQSCTGSFECAASNLGTVPRGSNSSSQGSASTLFKASKSNSIYGSSNTVQPPSVQYLPIIRY